MKTLSTHLPLNRMAVFALSGTLSLAQAAFGQNQRPFPPESPLPVEVEDTNPDRTACLRAITRSGDVADLCLRVRAACQSAIQAGGVLAPGSRKDIQNLRSELGWVTECNLSEQGNVFKVQNLSDSLLQKLDSPAKKADEAWLRDIADSLTRLNQSLNGYYIRMSPRLYYCIAEKTGEDAGRLSRLLNEKLPPDMNRVRELKTNVAAWKDGVMDSNLSSLLTRLDSALTPIEDGQFPQTATVQEISMLAQALSETGRTNAGLGYSFSPESAPGRNSFQSKPYPALALPVQEAARPVELQIKQLPLRNTWLVRLPAGEVVGETEKALEQAAKQLGIQPSSLEWAGSLEEGGTTKAIIIRRN